MNSKLMQTDYVVLFEYFDLCLVTLNLNIFKGFNILNLILLQIIRKVINPQRQSS